MAAALVADAWTAAGGVRTEPTAGADGVALAASGMSAPDRAGVTEAEAAAAAGSDAPAAEAEVTSPTTPPLALLLPAAARAAPFLAACGDPARSSGCPGDASGLCGQALSCHGHATCLLKMEEALWA